MYLLRIEAMMRQDLSKMDPRGGLQNDRHAAHLTTKPPKSGFTERGVGKCSDPVKKVL